MACPPWYLIRRRRWAGAVLVGLVWIVGVTYVGRVLYLFPFLPLGTWLFLVPGLLLWFVSGLLALLWGWWSFAGAIFWLAAVFWMTIFFSIVNPAVLWLR